MKGTYSVEALAKMPDFAGERRFVQMEKERARRERAKLPERPAFGIASKGWGLFRRADWTTYLRKLDKYEADLDKHQHEIKEGMIPFQILVTNEGKDDKSVWVHLTVENGRVDAKKKGPERPERLDEAPESKLRWPKLTRFVRYGIHVKPHSVEAVFSRLGSDESEYLVNDVMYLDLYSDTRITYAVRSKRVKSLHGEIEL
jgi:hypothetical protein